MSAGLLQFLLPVSAGQYADSQCPGAASGEHITDAVTDDHALVDRYAEPLGSGQEHVGVRLGMTDLVPCDDRHIGVEFQQLECVLRYFHASASRNRISHLISR